MKAKLDRVTRDTRTSRKRKKEETQRKEALRKVEVYESKGGKKGEESISE